METISASCNWLLTARREGGGVTLLRCATCDREAALPDTLWGLPVTALADHALDPSFRGQCASPDGVFREGDSMPDDAFREGEERTVRLVCGPDGGASWDNAALRTLTLPKYLRRVENYALYRCRALERLRLWDGVSFWGSGVLTGCRVLRTVEITQTEPADVSGWSPGGTLAYFAGEVSQELDVTVTAGETRQESDGTATANRDVLRLLFPAYRETYEENSPAHHFDYTIEGAGYPYHHCFRKHEINLLEYDSLWTRFRELGDPCAPRLAWYRVRYPAGLSRTAERAYWDWLRAHGRAVMNWLMEERDVPGLAFYLDRGQPDREAVSAALSTARARRATEAVALLLDYQRRRFPVRDPFAL